MFHSFTLEEQAFWLSRMIYRDTVIEDYHSNEVALDIEIYHVILKTVAENVEKVLSYHHIVLNIRQQQDVDKELRRMSLPAREEFIRYVMSIHYLSMCKCNWEPPEKIELLARPKDLAEFILDGHFIECCKNHCILSDSVMYYINKDIYNRIYTLLCENLLFRQ